VAVPIPAITDEKVRALVAIARAVAAEASRMVVFVVLGSEKSRRAFEQGTEDFGNAKLCYFGLNTDVYAKVIGCADIGIVLDGSRRGFDIAPEVTEMCAAGLPLLARRFGCISEYVRDGENGFFFVDQKGAIEIAVRLLAGNGEELDGLKLACKEKRVDWDEEFERAASGLFPRKLD
jgi:glycosyltransferase involved in cell wall biosynthesis